MQFLTRYALHHLAPHAFRAALQQLVAAAGAPAATVAAARNGPSTRVRTFPHVVGNFPTVVMLQVAAGLTEPLDALYRKVRRLLPDLEPMAQDDGPAAAAGGLPGVPGREREGAPPHRGYHISLSRTVPIRHPQIAPLTALLTEHLAVVDCGFTVALAGLRSFANDDGTRSFVSAMVTTGNDQVCALVRRVDAAFAAHGLPAFYEVPLPHVSVGWLPGDQRGRIDAALLRLQAQQPQVPAPAGPEHPLRGAASPKTGSTASEIGAWQAASAVCVVGQREYVVWKPRPRSGQHVVR
ncbi:hypothetical protein GPECTOR_3g412 [Gonium pectorale]|uniref:U6 snRNA phosphodiesterase 1 n=1 Tax=Gonium pectorale TaxID=33097 RepID=A0A150GZN4_GONPE|nr:hypothetical protein GPECTOR_3g412 [Gonium pectorale]|eukprot:KXZ55275.1 hypothetical protein GPECTOR_3g412 [Gonium pectorale]